MEEKIHFETKRFDDGRCNETGIRQAQPSSEDKNILYILYKY